MSFAPEQAAEGANFDVRGRQIAAGHNEDGGAAGGDRDVVLRRLHRVCHP